MGVNLECIAHMGARENDREYLRPLWNADRRESDARKQVSEKGKNERRRAVLVEGLSLQKLRPGSRRTVNAR